MGFDGTSAIVSGGAGGLGAAAVRDLVEAGARVVIADLDDDKGRELAQELGSAARYVRTDVLDDESVQGAIDAAGELATLRYAVVAHGGSGTAERILGRDGSPASFENYKGTIDTYLGGTYNLLRLVAAGIAKSEPDERGERLHRGVRGSDRPRALRRREGRRGQPDAGRGARPGCRGYPGLLHRARHDEDPDHALCG
jgi:NAD(P)-dependent dehydrogenase (short-subunit alcohol dehydrogenase family)